MISKEVINEIESKTNIVELIGEYVQLTARGDRYWGLSPFKNEKTASFCVTPSKAMFYCFSTHKGGSAVTFIMEMEGFSYPEAIEYLGKRAGIDVKQQTGDQFSKEGKARKALEELYTRIGESFHFLLTSSALGKEAMTYVEGRGINREMIDSFSLGYAPADPSWLYTFLKKRGYSDNFLRGSALFSSKNPRRGLFSNRLMFPIRRHQGDIAGFGGRSLKDSSAKYINSPDSIIFHKRQNLYGINRAKGKIKEKKSFILCEGYFDVIAFHQAGIGNAVAPLGTSFTLEQAKLLHRYAQKGIIIFDGDEAGIVAAGKASIVMEEAGMDADMVSLESGQDPAEILLKDGSQRLQNLVSLPKSSLDFILEHAISVFDRNTPFGKERIMEDLFPYINSIKSPVRREASLQVIADAISVSTSSIKEAFVQRRKNNAPRFMVPVKPDDEKTLKQYDVNPELLLMIALVVNPEIFRDIRPQLPRESIQGSHALFLYSLLEEHYRKENLQFLTIIEAVDNGLLKDLILKKASSNEYGDDPGAYVRSVFQRVQNDWLREKRKEIELLLRRKERSNDKEALRDLLSEKVYIDAKLENS